MKQKFITDTNKVTHNICPICDEIITYPNGVHFRNGIEIHSNCLAIARMRKDKIAGIDHKK